MALPITSQEISKIRTKITKFVRPIPESLISQFEGRISNQDFHFLYNLPAEKMVERFQSFLNLITSETFPQKRITISFYDQPWFTEELRKLRRTRQHRYERYGKDDTYYELKRRFEQKLKLEIIKYKEKIENQVREGSRGSAYPALRRLGGRPFETNKTGFQLPVHIEQGLSAAQSAEVIGEYFSRISQEFAPLSMRGLPQNIQTFLTNYDVSQVPLLGAHDVERGIRRAKKPHGLVPGDLPRKLLQNCASSLSKPVSLIFNKITLTAILPSQWRTEHQIAIPKIYPPSDENDLRNIAKPPFFSKLYEFFVGEWLLPIIKPHMDPGQCGFKGSSVTHYLIKLLHFIHSTLDKKKPHSVLMACVDISKAFNRVDHSLVIQDLYDMHTPAWLLRIIFSYLSDRSMVLTFNNAKSTQKKLPGGGPQGAFLGGIIFMIKFNGAFLRPPIPRPLRGPVLKSKAQSVKYVDDGAVAVSIDLKQCLEEDPVIRQKPVNYHERTSHVLPPANNLLQFYIHDAEHFTSRNKMIINKKKTNILSFTKSKKWDFPPELTFYDGTRIECIPDTKLVGVLLSDNLSWHKNTQYICQRARQKMWILRRMVKLELDIWILFDVYAKEVRSMLELAVPAWHSGLTKQQSAEIERVQKISFKLMLGEHYVNYDNACNFFCTETLEQRRIKLCLKFATKNLKSENSLFIRNTSSKITRQKVKLVKEFKCRTKRFEKSSLPYLAKLLNTASRTK